MIADEFVGVHAGQVSVDDQVVKEHLDVVVTTGTAFGRRFIKIVDHCCENFKK